MKKKFATYARIFIVPMLAIGGFVVTAPAAQAVTCYGDYCSGQDPESSGCSAGSYTATSYNNSYFSLQVRYSPTCKTNWTRLVMYSPGYYKCSHSGWFRAVQDTGYTQSRYFDSVCANTSVTRWTPMIYSPVRAVQGRFTDQNGATYVTPWA